MKNGGLGTIASQGLKPDPPSGASASPGNSSASISATAASYKGKSGTVQYYITSGALNQTANNFAYQFSGLSNGVSYSFTIQSLTPYGVYSDSVVTNSVTPAVTPVSPPVSPPVTPANCPPPGSTANDATAQQYCNRSSATQCAPGSLYGPGGALYDPIGFTCDPSGNGYSYKYYCAGCGVGPGGFEGGYFQQLRDGCCGYTAPPEPVGVTPPVVQPVGVTAPVVQPVGDPCAGSTCQYYNDAILSCTDACGNSGFQIVEYYYPTIEGCPGCNAIYSPCQAASVCGNPSNNGPGANGGNGWSWVRQNNYGPGVGGVCNSGSETGSIWYEYSKCGCSNYNLFITCTYPEPVGVTPPVTTPVGVTPPVVEPVGVTPPVVEPVGVTPPVSGPCDGCGGGSGTECGLDIKTGNPVCF